MKSDSPEAVLRRVLDLLAAMDIDGYVDLHAEDVVVEFPFAPQGWPQRLAGIDALREYMSGIGDKVRIESFPGLVVHLSEDPEVVIAEVHLHGTAVGTGAPYDVRYVWVVVVRDGKVLRFRDYWSPLQTSAVTGESA